MSASVGEVVVPFAAVRVLITGVSGFVGAHLAKVCATREVDLFGLARRPAAVPAAGSELSERVTADLTVHEEARAAIRRIRPDWVFHLAAEASVARSWKDPAQVIRANLASSMNLLEALRREAPSAKVLVAGSSEQYGPVTADRLPADEREPPRPQNPYAVSKAAVDVLAGFYADAYGMHVLRTRAFNHAGPGQDTSYAVSSFARQIAEAERKEARGRVAVATGNVGVQRDFTDVRDVVRAYWLAVEHGESGQAYNVCSGVATSIADILAGLARHTPLEIERRIDRARLRPHEVMEIRGSHDRLTSATGWQPEIPLAHTLRDTLDWWRGRVGAEVRG